MKFFKEDFKQGGDGIKEMGEVKDSFYDMVFMVNRIKGILEQKEWKLVTAKAVNVNKALWEVTEKLNDIREEINRKIEKK